MYIHDRTVNFFIRYYQNIPRDFSIRHIVRALDVTSEALSEFKKC
jgi:hypothetical protein